MLDVLETQLGCAPAGDLDHLRREVARDQTAVLANERSGQEAHVSRAGRELEHDVARPRIERLHHPLADRASDSLDLRPLTFPAGRHDLPVLEGSTPVLLAIHCAIVSDPRPKVGPRSGSQSRRGEGREHVPTHSRVHEGG